MNKYAFFGFYNFGFFFFHFKLIYNSIRSHRVFSRKQRKQHFKSSKYQYKFLIPIIINNID